MSIQLDRAEDRLRAASKFTNGKSEGRGRAKGAYLALLVLSALYFGRPEDVIPGLNVIPLAKIAGGIALLALILSLLTGRAKEKLAPEGKYLLGFFLWYCITIPFAYWRGGAFSTVMTRLSKGVIAALLVALLVREFWQLRRLVWVQAAAVALMTVLSVIVHHTHGGRLTGALGGVFENPNDLAINIALNWPLCVAFFFLARGFRKILWAAAILVMLVGVEFTYSRSGFLAIALAAVLVLWEFAIHGRRLYLILLAGMLAVAVLVVSPGHYAERIASIVTGRQEDTMDRGSREARKHLLMQSVNTALHRPIFGVGAGNFEVLSGNWHVAHNTYTEIAAEAGFPALFLFMLVLYRTFFNLRRVRKSDAYKQDPEVRILTGGLWVSVVAYLVSAFFASTEYSMYPYFLVAYTTALYQVTRAGHHKIEEGDALRSGMVAQRRYGRNPADLAWTR
jgi:putative inorganic carbon (hco3(-)) transporter